MKKEDLRNRKTENTLNDAMATLLKQCGFEKITVSGLCVQAQISRATFYAHFDDKYDLLKYMLSEVRLDIVKDLHSYDELERGINQFLSSNERQITNLFRDANNETLMIIRDFIASIAEFMIKNETRDTTSPNHIILLNFIIGGLNNLLVWIVENNYPPEISMMNAYLYNLLAAVINWDASQGQSGPLMSLESGSD